MTPSGAGARALVVVSGGYGHLDPLVPLARELEARGAHVAVAAPAWFAGPVAETGLKTIPLGGDGVAGPTSAYKAEQAGRTPSARGRAALARHLEQAVAQLPGLEAAAREWRPDVVVRETTAFAGWLAGERLDVPVAVLDFAQGPPRLLAAMFGDLFERARAAAGLPPDPRLATLHRWLHLLAAPPGWFLPATFGPTSHLLRPPPDPEPPPERGWPDNLDVMPPFVYVTLGTVFNDAPELFAAIVAGLAELPVTALATVGRELDRSRFGRLPERVRVEPFVSQAVALRHADVVVCHGGYGSLMGAVRHGTPVVVLPLASADHPANAARVEALGLGVVVGDDDRSVEGIRAAVERVLGESTYARSARAAMASLETLPPFSAAADLVLRLSADRAPVAAGGPVQGADKVAGAGS